MKHVIGYGDTDGTVFLSKEPKENSKTFSWVPQLASAHCFESEQKAQDLIDKSMEEYDNVFVLNVRMGDK